MTEERKLRSAMERARWLADMAEGLEIARRLLTQLPATPSAERETLALVGHLERAIAEVQALRRGGIWQIGGDLGPLRIDRHIDRLNPNP